MQGKNNMQKIESTRQKANALISSARHAAEDLFEAGDLHEYLDLLTRFQNLDVHNLLLILLQYPKAVHLSSQQEWKKLLDNPDEPIIKPEWRGKGIDVIVPYTDDSNNKKFSLHWISIKIYDISQTTLTHFDPPSTYIHDSDHISYLLESLKSAIASEYHRSVMYIPSSANLRATKLPGVMDEYTVMVRDDIQDKEKVYYLSECLSKLALMNHSEFTNPQINLATQQVCYCLQRIWKIPPSDFPHVNKFILTNVSKTLQLEYLSMLQTTVRSLDESISYCYRQLRQAADEIFEY